MGEPMDVDLSSHSASVMDISYTDSNIDVSIVKTEPESCNNDVIFVSETRYDPETLNKLIVQKIKDRSTSVIRTNSSRTKRGPIILILSLTFSILSVLTHQIINFNCYDDGLNIDSLKHNLITKVYGQTVAIQHIMKALDSEESTKILIFYGGTGVGKTFTTSILLENLLHNKNIYHYTMPSFLQTFSSEFMLGLLFCKSAVLVVDDLTSNDTINIKQPIKELVLRSENLSKNLTVIILYNCDVVSDHFVMQCDRTFPSQLRQNLEDIDAKKYFIRFESLTQEHLKKCIEDDLQGSEISTINIDKIVKTFNVTLNGCKGVHQKLQYMKIV